MGYLVVVGIVAGALHGSFCIGFLAVTERIACAEHGDAGDEGPCKFLGAALHALRDFLHALHLGSCFLQVVDEGREDFVAVAHGHDQRFLVVGAGEGEWNVTPEDYQVEIVHGTDTLGFAYHLVEVGVAVERRAFGCAHKVVGALDGLVGCVPCALDAAAVCLAVKLFPVVVAYALLLRRRGAPVYVAVEVECSKIGVAVGVAVAG